MNEIVLFDSSVLIDQIRTNRHLDRIRQVDGLIRVSSVVLAELWRGASSRVDRKAIEMLEANRPVLTPTTNNWLESGQILAKIRDDRGFAAEKLRDLHFDVLIALTARSHGARLITSNRADFELIREHRDFKLEVW
ncbi:MAG: type II toxin-antitoxin system VapC family toxin [Terracidiphilus sp.]|jgi:predicted nucleic acid-binding protein